VAAICALPVPQSPTLRPCLQGIVSRYRMGFASFRATFGLLIAFACASGAVVLLSTLLLTKPWTIQYTLLLPDGTAVGKGGYGHGWSHYGLIPLYFGGYATVVFAALSGTFVTMALRLRMSGERRLAEFSRRSTPLSQSSAGGGGSGHAAVEALTLRAKAPKLCVILTVMVTALIATACFSPVFNYRCVLCGGVGQRLGVANRLSGDCSARTTAPTLHARVLGRWTCMRGCGPRSCAPLSLCPTVSPLRFLQTVPSRSSLPPAPSPW
jgi:hypothetical protein